MCVYIHVHYWLTKVMNYWMEGSLWLSWDSQFVDHSLYQLPIRLSFDWWCIVVPGDCQILDCGHFIDRYLSLLSVAMPHWFTRTYLYGSFEVNLDTKLSSCLTALRGFLKKLIDAWIKCGLLYITVISVHVAYRCGGTKIIVTKASLVH